MKRLFCLVVFSNHIIFVKRVVMKARYSKAYFCFKEDEKKKFLKFLHSLADSIPCRRLRPAPTKKKKKKAGGHGYTTTLHLMQSFSSGERPVIPWLLLLPGLLWLKVVVPVRVQTMGQIDLFANYLYLIRILDII